MKSWFKEGDLGMKLNWKVVGLLSILVVGICLSSIAFAATSETQTPVTSVTVNSFVDTSIDLAAIAFGSLDPGTTANKCIDDPMNITNTPNSNTPVDIYFKGVDLTGAGTILIGNVSVSKTDGGAKTNLSGSFIDGAGPDQGYVEDLAVSGTQAIWYYLNVPSGQTAGAYTGNVTITSVATGETP